MSKNIKLIWDFRGPDAQQTAKHHAVHLRQYAEEHEISQNSIGDETLTPMHSIASITVAESKMPSVRDALKPHRGEFIAQGNGNE